MGSSAPPCAANMQPPLPFEVKPRVFIRTPGEAFEEIQGILSFERYDQGDDARIAFGFATTERSGSAPNSLLRNFADKYIDVKMEFMIGMLMVMSFSGFVEGFSEGKVTFAVSTPIETSVLDVAQ